MRSLNKQTTRHTDTLNRSITKRRYVCKHPFVFYCLKISICPFSTIDNRREIIDEKVRQLSRQYSLAASCSFGLNVIEILRFRSLIVKNVMWRSWDGKHRVSRCSGQLMNWTTIIHIGLYLGILVVGKVPQTFYTHLLCLLILSLVNNHLSQCKSLICNCNKSERIHLHQLPFLDRCSSPAWQ